MNVLFVVLSSRKLLSTIPPDTFRVTRAPSTSISQKRRSAALRFVVGESDAVRVFDDDTGAAPGRERAVDRDALGRLDVEEDALAEAELDRLPSPNS